MFHTISYTVSHYQIVVCLYSGLTCYCYQRFYQIIDTIGHFNVLSMADTQNTLCQCARLRIYIQNLAMTSDNQCIQRKKHFLKILISCSFLMLFIKRHKLQGQHAFKTNPTSNNLECCEFYILSVQCILSLNLSLLLCLPLSLYACVCVLPTSSWWAW